MAVEKNFLTFGLMVKMVLMGEVYIALSLLTGRFHYIMTNNEAV